MIHRVTSRVLLAIALLAAPALAHPDHVEQDLLQHWAPDSHGIEGSQVSDATHAVTARIVGKPRVVTHGPAQGWRFDGGYDRFVIADDFNAIRDKLPTRAFSVAAWVSLRSTQPYDSYLGVMQDNGDAETGWLLGNNKDRFTFALSTVGADDGNGKMTYLAGKTPLVPGRWYYVVGTYDGTTMRLYVNGELDAQSTEQSGDILYPRKAPVTLACYQDDNESLPLSGTVHRVKLYGRAMSPEEIGEQARKNRNMIDHIPDPSKTLSFLVKPYLQFATQKSIVIASESTRPATMIVEYGKRQPLEMLARAAADTPIAEVKLENLEPQTTYFYRVVRIDAETGEQLIGEIASFQTAVRDGMPWAFGVIGDTQRNPEITRKVADGLYGLRPNMLIHCGDVVDDGYAKNQWLQDLFEPMSNLLAYVPMYPVIGNHERDAHFYYDYFSLPKPEYWYTFTYGNAQFFMIDTNRPTEEGSEQYRWLEEQLSKSTARWKFTVHHHPCFSSDNDDYGDTIKGGGNRVPEFGDPKARPLITLYEKYGVDIAFAGHIHSYERTYPILEMQINLAKGVTYIVSGGGGGGLERAAPNRTWFQKQVHTAHHYCFANVHGDSIEFSAFDADGRLFDRFTLTRNEGK
jgi:predicted phosphodiesterase